MKKITIIFTIIFYSVLSSCNAQVIETIPLPESQRKGGMSLLEALDNRQSQRSFSTKELSLQEISNILWAAFGVTRPDGKRTAPTARDWREFDIYVVKENGWYIYEAEKNVLLKMGKEDLREYAGKQDFVHTAPLNLIFVADYERMTDASNELKSFYSATDVGFISQNVYLYCASAGLSTVVRAQIDRDKIREVFQLRPEQHPVLAQTVGYPGLP